MIRVSDKFMLQAKISHWRRAWKIRSSYRRRAADDLRKLPLVIEAWRVLL